MSNLEDAKLGNHDRVSRNGLKHFTMKAKAINFCIMFILAV